MIDHWILGHPILGQIHQIFHGLKAADLVSDSSWCCGPLVASRFLTDSRQPVSLRSFLRSIDTPSTILVSPDKRFQVLCDLAISKGTPEGASARFHHIRCWHAGMLWFQRGVLGNGTMQLHIFCRSLRIETNSGNSLEPWPEAKWAALCA